MHELGEHGYHGGECGLVGRSERSDKRGPHADERGLVGRSERSDERGSRGNHARRNRPQCRLYLARR